MKLKEKYKNFKEYIKITALYEFFIDSKNYYSKYRYFPWIFIISVCSVALLLIPIFEKNPKENTQTASLSTDRVLYMPIYVTIAGEVQKPGMYEMTEDDRISDVIEKAGGITENAYTENINLAQKLTDEQYIKIYSKNEIKTQNNTTYSNSNDTLTEIININTATAEELCKLPKIGETIANRIIEYREKNGGFKRIDEIKKVKGVGDKMYDKIKNNITI